jgi:hypothetical protein
MPAVDSAGVPYDKKLDPVLPDNFLLSIQGTKVLLTFIKDASGKVTWMRTRPFVAQRTAMPPSGFKVDAAKLRAVLRTLPRDPLLLR